MTTMSNFRKILYKIIRRDEHIMKNILELLYNSNFDWGEGLHDPESVFVRTARIRNETFDLLMESLTEKQKNWFDIYSEAEAENEDRIAFDQFCCAFHLGAQLMLEMVQGREKLLK